MKAKIGDQVTVIYDGFLENGELFESSETSGPLEFKLGSGFVMPDFENNIIDMQAGEIKSFKIPALEAHGLKQPELIHTMDRSLLPNSKKLKPGMVLGMDMEKDGKKHKIPAIITAIDAKTATIDFNHPLAGKDLTYKVTLQVIQPSEPLSSNG